jgi:hypothetical protein
MARWARAFSAVVIGAAIAAGGCLGGSPGQAPATGSAGPAPTLPGTPGHFENRDFSFDYPTDWSVIAADQSIDLGVEYLVTAIGVGLWHQNCTSGTDTQGSWTTCTGDTFDVPPGGIVLKIYWRGGGPAPMCLGNTKPNATVGPNPVQKTVDGTTTSWEIPLPGAEFGWPNNPIFEAHTSDPTQLARAQAVVASFRWLPVAMTYEPFCSPSPS